MSEVLAYMFPEYKHKFHLLVLQGGYITQTRKVPVRATSQYVNDFMNRACVIACEDQYLYRDKIPVSGYNLVRLELPDIMAKGMPEHFKLPTWGHILTNIALKNIIPMNNDYPSMAILPGVGKSEAIQERIDYHIELAIKEEAERNIGVMYNMYTDLVQGDVNRLLPIQDPSSYQDNRPDPRTLRPVPDEYGRMPRFNDMLLGPDNGPLTPWAKCWYLQHMSRSLHHIFVSDADKDKLLLLADHWHIIPVRSRTIQAQLAIVLEALHHNLLIPKPEPVTVEA